MESIFISMITQEQEAGMEVRYQVASDHEGQELRRFIKGKREFSSALWKRVKWNGKVLINGVAVHNARTVLHEGDEVILSWSEENEVVPSDIPLSIVYEDEDVLVVNKGPGMIIHPTSRNTHDTLVNAVAGYFERNHRDAGIHPVYRLDRNTTGLVVVAKSAMGQYELSKSHDCIFRQYVALVSGRVEPTEGVIEKPIGRKPGSIVEWMVRPDGKWAATEYRVLASSEEASLLLIHLRSGRTHQIRVHFSSLGHPLLGDDLYGGSLDLMKRQALHALSVAFRQPRKGTPLRLYAPMPSDMTEVILKLWGSLDVLKEV